MAYTYTLNDGTKVNSYHSANKLEEKYNQLQDIFTFIDLGEYTAFSDEFTHEYLNEKIIIGCLLRNRYTNLANDTFVSAHRLFCLESKTSFVYVTGAFWQPTPSFLHTDAFVTSVSEHFAEESRATPTNYNSYKKYFFKITPALAQSEYGITLAGSSDEFIVALVENNVVKAVRKLEPDATEGDAVLENWEALYILNAKKTNNRSYIRKLFETGYV